MFTADSVEVLVLVENQVDMLLADQHPSEGDLHCVTRAGLVQHFDPKEVPPVAENGLSLLVTARRGRYATRVLFDVGLTGTALAHNLAALGEDPSTIDHVVISHGHPDHYGGIHRFLDLVGHPVPVATHPDAFLPRYAVMGDGRTSSFYNAAFNAPQIEDGGGRLVLNRDAIDLGWGITTTGEIPREVAFEGPRPPAAPGAPGLYQVARDGHYGLDEVWDEQGLVIDVAGEGLVVLTGCAHAGVVNTVRQAMRLRPDRPVRAVMGGFHLGFPTTPGENVAHTVRALGDLGVGTIMPMHCSGLRAHTAFSTELANSYVQPAVGTVLRFGA
ncbi:MBL fold metallo-hydrolase [Nocardioides mesophilus]|uniref:MBL fold metallo-hydrolase n=1 Tax=Nocardioides mesophilus TaxID=433659 RepID=A0A7G9RG55_9ACTN|nr:MBL fold metallo-hydrolase [Nocardioides mesophilus]QNN54580.1 MBL fold metallo-hydrolase [Nocardioides mesophilus]